MSTIHADDAKGIFRKLGDVAVERSGRDFIYTITRASGEKVTGHVVTTQEAELSIATTEAPSVQHVNIPWDDIDEICLRVDP